ncbi:MAG: S1C family serine protease [Rubrivivax sp.]
MRRLWLIFAQAVTVAVAVLFVLATLKPDWVRGRGPLPTVAVFEAPPAPGQPALAGSGLRAAAAAALPAVVSVTAYARPVRPGPGSDPTLRFFHGEQPPRGGARAGQGSGVIVSPQGYLLTNHHVIAGASEVEVRLADGREATARVVGTDPETDIAVLQLSLERLPAITLGDSRALQVGDPVLAIGNPFNVGQTVTAGIVSALGRSQLGLSTYENFIQTDAAINPGNSGGALVDVRGALVGINTAIYSPSGASLGIGFAVPIDLAREVMDALVREGRVVRGWIGVEPRDLTEELAESMRLPGREGVLVAGVLQGGPASAAGLRPGDVVLALGGQAVRSTAEMLRAVAALRPGARVAIRVQRGAQRQEVSVTVGERPAASSAR